jgi:hypothetical protein
MLGMPEIRTRISREGAEPVGSTPEAFAARVKSEIAKWGKVIKEDTTNYPSPRCPGSGNRHPQAPRV